MIYQLETWAEFLKRRAEDALSTAAAIADFTQRFANAKYAIGHYDESEDGYEIKPNVEELTTPEEIIDCLKSADIDWQSIQTDEELVKELRDTSDWILFVEPLGVYQKRRQEEIRQTLEDAAAAIAIKHNCSVNSLEFLDACQSELEKFSDYRQGMREDGMCIGAIHSREQWFDEYNESTVDSDKIQKVIDWVSTNMPLLYGQWQYQREN